MGIVITKHTDSFTVDLGGLSADRKKARIRITTVRSIVADLDGVTVEVVFSNGEINSFPFVAVDSIDGDTDITSQDKLYDAMNLLIFT